MSGGSENVMVLDFRRGGMVFLTRVDNVLSYYYYQRSGLIRQGVAPWRWSLHG
jgi:hypothetical protein